MAANCMMGSVFCHLETEQNSHLLLEQNSMKSKTGLISLRKGIDVVLSGLHSFLTVTDHLFRLGPSEHRVALIRVIFCPPVPGHHFQGYSL